MSELQKKETREPCSWDKGHKRPDCTTYQKDLLNWYSENSCRGEYESIDDVASAIARLRDYINPQCEMNWYGWPSDLDQESRGMILQKMLWKMQTALDHLKK